MSRLITYYWLIIILYIHVEISFYQYFHHKNIHIFRDSAEIRKSEEIVDLVFNECKKENISYRMVALKTLGELLEKLNIDRFAQTYQLVMHVIQKV